MHVYTNKIMYTKIQKLLSLYCIILVPHIFSKYSNSFSLSKITSAAKHFAYFALKIFIRFERSLDK